MRVLVTGATGYIGSHACVELLVRGHDVIGVDDLSMSTIDVRRAIERTAGQHMEFHELDLRNEACVEQLFAHGELDAVMHFAGRKFVGESVEQPILYYSRNVAASITLFGAAQRHGVDRLVFSSSCTVYGNPEQLPVSESAEIRPVSPYGKTKAAVEDLLRDLCQATPGLRAMALRYFNPIGAHPDGLIGEHPLGAPNNLVPYVMQVATGERAVLSVFGDDYPTPDGTCVRDYVHVVDVAKAHVLALDAIDNTRIGAHGFDALNLGTGRGHSVLDVLRACRSATERTIAHQVVDRRPGDAAMIFADASRAVRELGWQAEHGLDEMCAHHWSFARRQADQRASAS